MQLNPDCIRDILLDLEDKTSFKSEVIYNSSNIPTIFPNYKPEEIYYHLRQCNLDGLLFNARQTIDGSCFIADLTPKAHDFLANIHSDNLWDNVKEVSAKVGTKSLSAIVQIASNIVTCIIKSQLGM